MKCFKPHIFGQNKSKQTWKERCKSETAAYKIALFFTKAIK